MCRVYHIEYCPNYQRNSDQIFVKPDLSLDNQCHHNHNGPWGRRIPEHTEVTFRFGDSAYNLQHSCAGALVSPDSVLTAARCASLGWYVPAYVRQCVLLQATFNAGPFLVSPAYL